MMCKGPRPFQTLSTREELSSNLRLRKPSKEKRFFCKKQSRIFKENEKSRRGKPAASKNEGGTVLNQSGSVCPNFSRRLRATEPVRGLRRSKAGKEALGLFHV